ncbi:MULTISPECIES: hypothetical protein [unclassified Pseudomonas]|uniref:hypothetical protein n=1 Tax=unclassified Pseudomonas TaxID=196821 RepID=UPI002448C699|nr:MULTISPECIES: hypothetical protein [unclassified Pseudomonas]MDH0896245.1 hypothetical protein [Pseudomonas sp. GD03875]MDH1064965.1 hypothetical protein [Pseudomonas sp. GD03985]
MHDDLFAPTILAGMDHSAAFARLEHQNPSVGRSFNFAQQSERKDAATQLEKA